VSHRHDCRRPPVVVRLGALLGRAVALTVVLLVLCGVVYPAVALVAARVAFPAQSHGSLVRDANGRVVGSTLLGQAFARPEYFHGRRSAVAYDGGNSGGSNLGPSNPVLADSVRVTSARVRAEDGVPLTANLPADLVTASGSGLDPDISPASAALQVDRVARARGLAATAVARLVGAHTTVPTLGLLGEPRVNVLRLNLALDSASTGH
jgi:potassium-transporting ATPase KdpC subunit